MNAQTGKVGGKARFSRGDAKIWNQGDPEAAADSASLYCPDHGLFAAEKANRLSIQLPCGCPETLGAKFIIAVIGLPGAEVGPGAEVFALSGEDDGSAARRIVQGFEGVGDLLNERVIEEIVGGTLNLHRCHGASFGNGNVGVGALGGHGASPKCRENLERWSIASPGAG